MLLHLEELAEKKKTFTDPEVLRLYDKAFGEVIPTTSPEFQESWGRIIGALRWFAVKSLPKDEKLSLKSFKACLASEDLEHARQVRCSDRS